VKELKLLRDRCLRRLDEADKAIDEFCAGLGVEDLLQIIELSDQPLLFDVDQIGSEDPKAFLLPPVKSTVENQIAVDLESAICDMCYGDYVQLVDAWLSRQEEEDTSEEEMAVVDQMQCDLELPHVCGRAILEMRHE
jgi:hypothetical protein